MNKAVNWHIETLGEKTVQALNNNHFKACFFSKREQALEKILSLIPNNAVIGAGGSWTIKELGLLEKLEERNNPILNHSNPNLTPQEAEDIRRKQQICDVFLTGTNAVTLDGTLVNVDGTGNRVAAMIYGPKKVIIVAGINKIVRNLEEAINRIKLIAAPINAKRLNKATPCAKTGECMNCNSPDRICSVTTIMDKCPRQTDIHVIIIGEQLGF